MPLGAGAAVDGTADGVAGGEGGFGIGLAAGAPIGGALAAPYYRGYYAYDPGYYGYYASLFMGRPPVSGAALGAGAAARGGIAGIGTPRHRW